MSYFVPLAQNSQPLEENRNSLGKIRKLFQRINFACLAKELFTVKLYRILRGLRNFFRFSSLNFTEFKISSRMV